MPIDINCQWHFSAIAVQKMKKSKLYLHFFDIQISNFLRDAFVCNRRAEIDKNESSNCTFSAIKIGIFCQWHFFCSRDLQFSCQSAFSHSPKWILQDEKKTFFSRDFAQFSLFSLFFSAVSDIQGLVAEKKLGLETKQELTKFLDLWHLLEICLTMNQPCLSEK